MFLDFDFFYMWFIIKCNRSIWCRCGNGKGITGDGGFISDIENQETEPETPEIVLTPEEKNMVSAFAEKIDLANSNMILQYGAGPRKKWRIFRMRR